MATVRFDLNTAVPKRCKCTQAYARQHPKVRESKRRLVCINRTPSEAEVHTKAERPASTTFTGPQGWRPWTPRPRYLPNTPYLTSTPYSPLDTKGIETTFGFSIERRQRPRSTPKPRRPSTLREVPVTNRRAYKRLSPYHVPHQGLPRLRAGGGVVIPSPIRSVNWTGRSPSKQAPPRAHTNPNQSIGRHRMAHTLVSFVS